jgi:hypothetical protein
MCLEHFSTVQNSFFLVIDPFLLFLRTYACVVYFFLGKSAGMFGAPPTQFYERRKDNRSDVDASEGSSGNPSPSSKVFQEDSA